MTEECTFCKNYYSYFAPNLYLLDCLQFVSFNINIMIKGNFEIAGQTFTSITDQMFSMENL
jgi:hypothetical protein